ncbi:phosphoribosyltransferase [Dendrosporobacter sp. 1207_IL3150]|uniref:phosphoribosyltransferase n=1 Tax=Dendrosporobacter sp. 1207_IL3150 TaxID=3084054 RepID=UPI002FD8E88C
MFKNRLEAGEILAEIIKERSLSEPYLLAVPRGGVVVAVPIAQKLGVGLGVLIARKIGHPLNPEVAIGAVMPDGSAVYDPKQLSSLGVGESQIKAMIKHELNEIQRRLIEYTGNSALPNIQGKTVVIVDDGIATGYTIKAAIQWLKTLNPGKITIAVPVAPPEVISELDEYDVEVICPVQPEMFMAVGMYYEDFSQTEDDEVIKYLKKYKLA